MEFLLDFEKSSISKRIEKFLLENLNSDKDKESLSNVISGKPILKADVLTLLRTLLQAMTFTDVLDDEEFNAVIPDDDEVAEESKGEPTKNKSETDPGEIKISEEFPTLAQSMTQWNTVGANGKKISPGSSKAHPPTPVSKNTILTGDELLHKFSVAQMCTCEECMSWKREKGKRPRSVV